MNILLEVCCGSADDVIQAYQGGANRVELNSCLFHGGLTPSVGELIVAKRHVPIPVMTMIRPRQGGFCYPNMHSAMRMGATAARKALAELAAGPKA